MPKYLIERSVPGAGRLSAQELQAIAQKSCSVLRELGPQIQWVQSYVTSNKIYCIYIAPNEDTIREHAKQGGFPADTIAEVKSTIDPTTAEQTSPSSLTSSPSAMLHVAVTSRSRKEEFLRLQIANRVA